MSVADLYRNRGVNPLAVQGGCVELRHSALLNDASLVFYLPMEGDSHALLGPLGTDTDITYSAANGRFGQGAGFDGNASKIVFVADPVVANFSYFAWIKVTDVTSIRTIKSGRWVGPNAAPQFRINTSGNLQLVKSQTVAIGTSTGTVTNGVYQHVAVTYDSSGNYAFYIDGLPAGSGTNLQTLGQGAMLIGCNESGYPALVEFFKGAIDDVAIFSRVLTAAEIWNFYCGV